MLSELTQHHQAIRQINTRAFLDIEIINKFILFQYYYILKD